MLKEKGKITMKCAECQNEIPVGSVFCPICGSAVFEEPVAVIPEPEPVTEINEEPISVSEKKPLWKKLPVQKLLGKKLRKWWILAAVCLLTVVALVIFAGHRSGYGVYTTGGSVFLTDLSGGEPVMLMEYGSCWDLVITEDQEHLFYQGRKAASQSRDVYHLDLRTLSKEPEKLAENVSSFYVNAQGTRAVYIREGNLYVHDLSDEKLIAENVVNFLCDEDIDTFAYSQTITAVSSMMGQVWYYKDGDAEPRIVGDGRSDVKVLRLTADGMLIYSMGEKFYVWKDHEEILIAENATRVSGVYEDGSFYYQTENAAGHAVFCFYDGKQSVEITDSRNVQAGLGKQPTLWWLDDQSGHCFVAVGENVLEIPLELVQEVVPCEDGRSLHVTTQGEEGKVNLYTVDISRGKVGQVQLLVENAPYFRLEPLGNRLYYWVGETGKPGELYCDGERILENVSQYVQIQQETGTILIQGGLSSGNFLDVYMVRDGKAIKLTEEGRRPEFASNGDVLVCTNYTDQTGELWCFDRNGKGKLLADNVYDVLAFEELKRPSSQMNWIFDYYS